MRGAPRLSFSRSPSASSSSSTSSPPTPRHGWMGHGSPFPFFLLSPFRHEMHGSRFIRSPPVIILLRCTGISERCRLGFGTRCTVYYFFFEDCTVYYYVYVHLGGLGQCPATPGASFGPGGGCLRSAAPRVSRPRRKIAVNTRRGDPAPVLAPQVGCADIRGPLTIAGPMANPSRKTRPTAHYGGPQPADPRAVAHGSALRLSPFFAHSRGVAVASAHKLIPSFRKREGDTSIPDTSSSSHPPRCLNSQKNRCSKQNAKPLSS